MEEENEIPKELMQKPREYTVKFSFPNPTPLNPPILGAYGKILCGVMCRWERCSDEGRVRSQREGKDSDLRGFRKSAFHTTEMSFGYERQPLLLKDADFGIDMQSRGM